MYSFADQMFEHLKLRILFRPYIDKVLFHRNVSMPHENIYCNMHLTAAEVSTKF